MKKMRMASPDTVAMNRARLAALADLFPGCITETRDASGRLKQAVDMETLQTLLTGLAAEGPEAYTFTWVGKRAAMAEAARPIRKTLRPLTPPSKDWNHTENLYIEGDNLDALKLLQESYLGKVKMIYIDPPYNTGHDFLYKDKFRMDEEDYAAQTELFDEEGNKQFEENSDSNPRFHSDWCSMMYPRLLLARNLLTDDGVIFISIDENEHSSLKMICDEIFGNKNFFGELTWESTTQPTNSGAARFGLQKKTETLLLYAKNKSKFGTFQLQACENTLSYPHFGKFGKCRFEIIEKSDAGNYNRPSMKFKILGQYPRPGKRWQIGEEKARQLEHEGKLEIINGIVKRAIYPEDELDKQQYKPFWSFLPANVVGTAQTGKDELNTLLGCSLGFDTVKPVELIIYLISLLPNNSLILDFFSGSATTAHAVMQLNAKDGGHRKFIMVQAPEPCAEKSEAYKAGYRTICDIGEERIRRAGEKIRQEHPEAELDTGFRVFRVDSTNMEDVYYSAGDYAQEALAGLTSNIKPDRSALDVFFGCVLDWGLPLDRPYETEEIADYAVHNYDHGALLACFADAVSEELVRAMAQRQPLRAVFRDSSFPDSPAKINAEEIFKMYSPLTKIKVI